MYKAYNHGKDLYAMIAQSAYHNNYEDNLEFYPAGTEIEVDGQKVICGNKTHLHKAGKERRSVGKVLNLAATYGMSGRTAGIRLGYEGKEAKEKGEELLNNFFGGFPGVKTAIDQSKDFLKKEGYVEDFLGRRRRLTDINLAPYSAKLKIPALVSANFNPFLICGERKDNKDPEIIWDQILKGYVILANCRKLENDCQAPVTNEMANYTFEKLKKIAANPEKMSKVLWDAEYKPNKNNVPCLERIIKIDMPVLLGVIKDHAYKDIRKREGSPRTMIVNQDILNLIDDYVKEYGYEVPTFIPNESVILNAWTGRIAQASRQCFNARIQGSAASLTKMAMVDIFNDEQLKAWDAHLIITVHDEVLVECPEQYADLVEKRLPEIMVNAAKEGGDDVPQACDPYNVSRWYCDTAAAFIRDEFKKLEHGNKEKGIAPLPREKALEVIFKNHTEVPQEAILKSIETGCDLEF